MSSDFLGQTTRFARMHWVPLISIIAGAVGLYLVLSKNKCVSTATSCTVPRKDYSTLMIVLWIIVIASLLGIWFSFRQYNLSWVHLTQA